MHHLYSAIKRYGFFLYVLGLFSVPFALLFGLEGALWAMGVSVLILWIGFFKGPALLAKKIRLQPLNLADFKYLNPMVKEYSRRLKISPPQVFVLDHAAVSSAVLGLNPSKGTLILTTGALKNLKRPELAALVARQLVLFQQACVGNLTWMVLFLWGMDKIIRLFSGSKRKTPSARILLNQVLLYPLALIPQALLKSSTPLTLMDEKSARLVGSRRVVIETLKKVETYNARLHSPVEFYLFPLFLHLPKSMDPMSLLFFAPEPLSTRIQWMERAVALEN